MKFDYNIAQARVLIKGIRERLTELCAIINDLEKKAQVPASEMML